MLKRIFIQNYALIDTLDIDLKKGLQVITGETGAGKSIILGALRLIMGERADAKSIQNTESKSIIEAEFDVSENLKTFFEENDLDYEPITIIRREILPSGKSRAFVNDVPTTLDVLRELSAQLIDIHSQFETSRLFSEDYQFKILDGLSENKELITTYQKDYHSFRALKKQLAELENQLNEGNKDSDYKQYLLNELEEAQLDDLDLDAVQQELYSQENVEHISENLAHIFRLTDQESIGLLDSFTEMRSKLSKVADLSHQFTELNDRLESLFVEFKDIVFELQSKAEDLEMNPERLEELKDKVNKTNTLLLKHKVGSVSELIEIRDQLATEQTSFSDIEERIAYLKQEITDKETQLRILAEKLSKNRNLSAPEFSEKIETLLRRLGLEKAKIEVQLTPNEDFSAFGLDGIAIMFQANTGFPLKPIQSAISGGERSRVMLAIKKIMAENAELPTLILDEIDTGVSGKVAEEIGLLMKEMSADLQLIVITHLAQVASKGSDNYKVIKQDIDGKTKSSIIPLSPDEKLQEIAQLLSGSTITDAAIEQARALILGT
ncbi:DNA repair protein RecN [Bergeyella cardium]|uniref:DNA repair protein RecN n=1 Tax=Bergeyella cardium TaxID=1585976 RepID=A0A6P1QTV0_9FLAO|nr:DNA repair protein RecN [Bergeyella cardium]QHN64928.1 DNA repair protein RecN [Bergeyella cardium]WHE34239.1 DNA repair protein RecN [Bergeyella cardium]WHF60890.1 DNA repair protein RecN [Bergeyella cardium]